MFKRLTFGLALGLVLALALTGCGGAQEPTSEQPPAQSETPTAEQRPAPSETPTAPSGPVTSLIVEDIEVGDGAEAKSGSVVTVNYAGYLTDGTKFDSSWDAGQPFQFALGQGQVIPGWDQGVAGMKVGGRRKLIIPPDMAYGEQGAGSAIPPNATLIFIVDLLDVQ